MKNIGLLGGGQLGRMLALAGYPLGLRFRTLDPSPETPAGHLTDLYIGHYENEETLESFAKGLELVTYEFENVPITTSEYLEKTTNVYPPTKALEISQERLKEKRFFSELGIPTNKFYAIDSKEDIFKAAEETGFPAVLKTRRFGYDGKGQKVVDNPDEALEFYEAVKNAPLIMESFVKFERELSIIGVRNVSGDTAFYPLVENDHRNGILFMTTAPAGNVEEDLQKAAEAYAEKALNALNYVGVLAIEFFEDRGSLIANEMAPRVHNSGHWTIEGAETSQFENHLRAILDMPLGDTTAVGHSAMINLIGEIPDVKKILQMQDVHLHLYDKEARPSRKLGHVTVWMQDKQSVDDQVRKLLSIIDDD